MVELLTQLVKQDPLRVQALTCLHTLNLAQGYIAAGFVRNLIWDHLHHYTIATPLNDIDVIYFDESESEENRHQSYQNQLAKMMPEVNWQVKNQAIMHKRNSDMPYKSSCDAMRYWPEKETAVAIRQLTSTSFETISAFGFESLFSGKISYNPKREKSVFKSRIDTKGWLKQWPNLKVMS